MRWFRIRKANIDASFREWFEQRGVDTTRAYIPLNFSIRHSDGTIVTERKIRPHLLEWLTEQYDKAERKETWSLTMEVAITILVAAELILMLVLRGAPK